MAAAPTGVYPVYENQFKVGATKEAATTISDMETFSVSFDNGIEEWTPFNEGGYAKRLMTAKSITIGINGKRNVGDEGNNFVASKAFANGRDAEGVLIWKFPDGTEVDFNVVFNVTNIGTGDSTNAAALEFEALSNGKPTVTIPPVTPPEV